MNWVIVGNEIQHKDGDRFVKFDSHSNNGDFSKELRIIYMVLNAMEKTPPTDQEMAQMENELAEMYSND